MKQRLADYIVDFLAARGVSDVFSVVGGGAMHLNDAFGHRDDVRVTYCHHEQACAIAAESYARLEGRPAAVCVTSGPGGTNALTGVLGAWLDSIPTFVVSGQVRYDTTARYALKERGAKLRAMGDQEYDIVRSVAPMTKYAVMIEDPRSIRYHLERAWRLATTGRPGPVWIDVPVNFQGAVIETDDLPGYDPKEDDAALPPPVSDATADLVLEKIRSAKRPVFYAGYGIRLSGAYGVFREAVDVLGVPVVTYWNAIDLIEDDHPLYVGRGGNMGDRAGNFAVQNADLILAVGTRISIRQTGYNFRSWAREAEVIMVDIDPEEFKKPTIHVDLPIFADAGDFLFSLLRAADGTVFGGTDWLAACARWKKKYPVVRPEQLADGENGANVYAFIRTLGETLPEGQLTAASNGACCVVGNQAFVIKRGTRFILNSATASMGYGLPAAVGLCIAGGRRDTVCLEGDGSIMMNLQELQTVVTNRLPVKIFLINNGGYHSIRITQTNIFPGREKVGIGPDSGDLSFPEFKKIAGAFGIPYFSIKKNSVIGRAVSEALSTAGPAFVEVFTDKEQVWEPKNGAKKLADGTIVSPPLEDMAPFLPKEELERNMLIPPFEMK